MKRLLLWGLSSCAVAATAPPTVPSLTSSTSTSAAVEVPDASDERLRDSLRSLRPRVELVSQTCARDAGEDESVMWEGRLCVRDAAGHVQESRRVALDGRVLAEHVDDLVVFGVSRHGVATRYSGRWWRWNLRSDRVEPLFDFNFERFAATSFGVLLFDESIEGDSQRVRLVTQDAVQELRSPGPLALVRVENETYDLATNEIHRVVIRDAELVLEPFVRFGPGTVREQWHVAPRTMVALVEREDGVATLQVVDAPSPEVTTIALGLRRPEGWRRLERMIEIAKGNQRVLVDLDSRTVTRFRSSKPRVLHLDSEPEENVTPSTPLAVHDVAWRSGALEVTTRSHEVRIAATSSVDDAITIRPRASEAAMTTEPATRCRCEDEALICSGARTESACVRVDGDVAPVFDATGRYRVDRVDPDWLRVTRLADGERLWLRVTTVSADAVDLVAQTDDGTYDGPSAPDDWWVRTGLGSDSVLAPLDVSARRPGLVARFFAGETT